MKKTLGTVALILSIFLNLTMLSSYVYAETSNEIQPEQQQANTSGEDAVGYMNQAANLILSKYRFDAEEGELYKAALEHILKNNPELLDEAFSGMFNSLDQHSTYYTEEQMNSFINDMSGELCGIGVLVMTVDDGIMVMDVYDNTPAKEAGIIVGDIITAVDGQNIAGLDISIAQSYVTGKENTPVVLTIQRNESKLTITAVRRKVTIDSGWYQCIENNSIGYISLSEFNETASEFIQKALDEFDSKHVSDIIIDLRNNPGGSLRELVDICTLFIPEGPAIHLDFKNPLRNYTLYSENQDVKYNLIILINNNSASASEAFAGAVQDTGVGIVLGQTSYGKGTMQVLTNFVIGGGIKLTEAVYLTPAKRSINGIGIVPDLPVTDKVTSYEKSEFEKMTYERIMKSGDVGKDVLAIEQRLHYLGLFDAIADEIYDEQTHDAVKSFQGLNGLYEYGVMDITTQLKLDSQLRGIEITNDTTLKSAINIFKNENWQDYRLTSPDNN